ncbi:hypothetical protein [Sorangium sp. So ce1389]
MTHPACARRTGQRSSWPRWPCAMSVEQGQVVVDAIARAGERRYAACFS